MFREACIQRLLSVVYYCSLETVLLQRSKAFAVQNAPETLMVPAEEYIQIHFATNQISRQ